MASLFPKVCEQSFFFFKLCQYSCSKIENVCLCFFASLGAEATFGHCSRLLALVDFKCVSASERMQEGDAVRGRSRTGHAAGHPAGHPMCFRYCQGSKAACYCNHKGKYQLTTLQRLQSNQHLSSVFLILSFLQFVLWYMHVLFGDFFMHTFWQCLKPTLDYLRIAASCRDEAVAAQFILGLKWVQIILKSLWSFSTKLPPKLQLQIYFK